MADAVHMAFPTPSRLLLLQLDGVSSCSAGLEGINKSVVLGDVCRSCSPFRIVGFEHLLTIMYTIERDPRPNNDSHGPHAGLHFNPSLTSQGFHNALEAACPTTPSCGKRLQAAVQASHLEEASQVLARVTADSAQSSPRGLGTVEPKALQSSPLATSRSELGDPEVLLEMRDGMASWKLPGTRAPKQRYKRRDDRTGAD